MSWPSSHALSPCFPRMKAARAEMSTEDEHDLENV